MFAFVFLFIGISSASAATDCVAHPEQCQSNGSPEFVMNVWGTTNSQIPHTKPGTVVLFRNQYGQSIDLGCPAWYPFYCVDITVTQYWKERWGTNLTRI